MMNRGQQAAIERFVRGTLGCQCPDEVFRNVEVGPLALPGGSGAGRRLVIGDRLLIHVVTASGRPDPLPRIEEIAIAGRDERDRRGLNRFRLVVGMPAMACDAPALEQRFRRALGDDDRAHLHVVAAGQLPIV
jgi:hypothetical protein